MICLNCGGIITLTRSEGRKLALYEIEFRECLNCGIVTKFAEIKDIELLKIDLKCLIEKNSVQRRIEHLINSTDRKGNVLCKKIIKWLIT